VLWLFENQIKKIEGLEHCKKLRMLNISQNLIEEVGDALLPNQNLQVVPLCNLLLISIV
jgi:Leucine-rich repeat (LRR) protein